MDRFHVKAVGTEDRALAQKIYDILKGKIALGQWHPEAAEGDRSVAYTNKVLSVLKHMLSKAVDWDMADEALLKRARKVKPLGGENKRLRYLSLKGCRRLVEACDAHLRPIVICALNPKKTVEGALGSLAGGELPMNDTLRELFQGWTSRRCRSSWATRPSQRPSGAHLAPEHRTEAVRKLEARTGSRKGESITILLRSEGKRG